MGKVDDERRRAERIRINAEFAAMSPTYISDLSEYGVFVHTPSLSPMGTTLKLRFTVLLDDPVIVEAEGRVVRHQEEPTRGMGIEFTDLAPEMILRINDVVARQRPRDSGPPLGSAPPEGVSESASTLIRGQQFKPPPLPGAGGEKMDDAKTSHYPVVQGATSDESE